MEKALEMGKVSAAGSFQLFIGKAASTIILAVGAIILARLMLPAEYGLYSIALIPAMMISLFQDWGVGSAMTKYIAHFRAENKNEHLQDVVVAGVTFEVITGLALSFLSLLLASFIASTIFRRPESTPLISIASVTIFSGSLVTASQSSFVGFERMELSSFTMIFESVVKSVIAPLLVFFGYGAFGAVLGYTLSLLISGIAALSLLYFLLFKNLRKTKKNKARISDTLKKMLHYGVPLSISSILGGFRLQFYRFLMAFFCTDIIIGNYQVAANFAVLLTFFTYPISTVLFPTFSKLDSNNKDSNSQLIKTVFTSSVKYTSLLLVPAAISVMVLSKPMISTLFGEKYVYAPFFLTLYVISNLFVSVGSLSMGSLLAGLGETKTLMKLSLLSLLFSLPLAFILIPTLVIVGVILGSLFAGLPSMFIGLRWIWKHYKVKADLKSSAKIFAASIIAALTTYLSLIFLSMTNWIELIIEGTIFLLTYTFTSPIIGAVTKSDINNLKFMFSGLGLISKIINILLTIAEKATLLSPTRQHSK